MEKSVEKAEQQAEIIKMIALPVLMLDVEYCREAANDMCNQANRQESMAVLNPNHPQVKNDILRTQGKELQPTNYRKSKSFIGIYKRFGKCR